MRFTEMFRGVRGYVAQSLSVAVIASGITFAALSSTPATEQAAPPRPTAGSTPTRTASTDTATSTPSSTTPTTTRSTAPTRAASAAPAANFPLRDSLGIPEDGTFSLYDAATQPDSMFFTGSTPQPGTRLATTDPSGNPVLCTLGAFARGDTDGLIYGITAGHCTAEGTEVKWGANRVPLGVTTKSVNIPRYGDYAIFRLYDQYQSGSAISAAHPRGDLDSVAYTADMSNFDKDTNVCKSGFRTGETCGPLMRLTRTQLMANLFSRVGDSGGIAYAVHSDGTREALGLLHGSPTRVGDDPIDSLSIFTSFDQILRPNQLHLVG